MGLKDKDKNTSITGYVNFGETGDMNFGEVIWVTANLRWSKDGVLEQMWTGINGEQVWLSVAVENVGE